MSSHILEFVCTIAVCSSSHILGIDLQGLGSNFFQKPNSCSLK
ncbi:hypothetical protein LEP1GSC021_0227 [Leptospira noguchii str. 1993005606]|uniref:Uncharacterized protein n=2 Tax=Leptospira noguchii TaxID=28182 RepID=M6Y5M0_9LEPT|nr:hypothetical protein LEP1GSC035_2494 [Leptospira noguchii str. 2007001578]EMO88990.1 hypothetical protein LEP1GSC024_4269 [Leptospira noguchii str. 2001034031]EPE82057.1 hypothetical protein LEP1GSC021_0227 [Leptospira noguchii str. 1993005606]